MQVTFATQYHRRSSPPGVDIIANEIGLDLIVGGVVFIGMSLRQEPLMFLPEVASTHLSDKGPVTELVSIANARVQLAAVFINSVGGGKVMLGDELLAAFDEHEKRWRDARGKGAPLSLVKAANA